MNPTRVGLYIRCSTEEQAKHGYTVQAQRESLLDYCKSQKYKVIDLYIDEGKTARTKLKNRKEMLRLLEDIKLKRIDRVVFIKLDRWFRNVSDYYKIQEILDKNKVDWETTQEEYNTTTTSGRLNLNIRLSIAQDEADRTGDRIRFTFENMIKNKRAIVGKQGLPLGYKVETNGKEKRVVKDQEKANIVLDMFNHFKTYQSARKTLLYINDKYNLSIHHDSLRHYLKNKLYTGYYRDVEHYCEPYLTNEEFNEIQIILKKNIKHRKIGYDYIFSGLLKCKNCSISLAGYQHRCTRPKYHKTYKYPAYKCNKAYNSKLCSNTHITLESSLEKYLLSNIENEIKQYILTIEEIKFNEIKIKDNKKLEAKLNRLNDLYIDGRILKEKYDNEYLKISNELKKDNIPKVKNTQKLKELLNSDVMILYNKLNNQSKRALWRTYIEYIEIGDGKPNIIFK